MFNRSERKPAKCTCIIVACAVLHNLRLQWGEPTLEAGEDVEDAVPGDQLQAEYDGRHVRNLVVARCFLLGMRRYGDISIQYRYGGSRYVSWPSAIYRDTTLTLIKKGSHYVVSTFSYLFKKYNLCRRCWLICLLKWTFKWTILH